MASQSLNGRKVAILLAPAGSEQVEFTEPKKAVQDAGADVDVISAEAGRARTYNHESWRSPTALGSDAAQVGH